MKRYSFLMAAAMLAVIGCEKSPEEINSNAEGNVYMQFSVKMLTTKSSTDDTGNSNSDANPDTEVGKEYENAIKTVDIALVNKDKDSYFVSKDVKIASAATDTYVASFNSTSLTPGATYNVYIYANCKAPNIHDIDEVSSATIAEMTNKDNGFWMTNALAAKPVTLPADLAPYTNPSTPFDLEDHYVERSMARFDYMARNKDNVYSMGDDLTLTLTDAALINQSKKHYMFRRVAADVDLTENPVQVGGAETPLNWVVDTDWDNKVAANFDAPLADPTIWGWTSLKSLTENDNWTGEADDDHKPSDYKIWCYAKENTIPGADKQKHDVSTGIVFKAEIKANESASALKTAMATGNRIYAFQNVLYGTWENVKAAATASGADPKLAAAYYQAIVGMTETATNPVSATAADAGFTGYSAVSENGGYHYYTYYYYWNRHNDNGDPYNMGIMEFAVVRNNVYKLCVDSIQRLGHPTPPTPTDPDPDPDPDPVDPEDPDESVNYYFTVTVKVLPWTVRVNHIEF
ncbi:MAG: Mfa1 family fimbria major subunit [Candidatus Cryptobacteroides sp.]